MQTAEIPEVVAAVAITDKVMFPDLLFPFTPGRDRTVAAVENALQSDPPILLLVRQAGGVRGEPATQDDLSFVGTLVLTRSGPKLTGRKTQVVVQGLARARIIEVLGAEPFLMVRIEKIEEPEAAGTAQERALIRAVREDLRSLAALDPKKFPSHLLALADSLDAPGRLADLVASHLEVESDEAQQILETIPLHERLLKAAHLLSDRLEYLKVRVDLEARAQSEMGKSRQSYFLRQQLKTIQDQLGQETHGDDQDIDHYLYVAREKSLPEEARREIERCVQRLRWSSPGDAESTNLRCYLDCLTSLPWQHDAIETVDILQAERVLNEHHWGLKAAKERILEFLAIQALNPASRGPILCLLGPPGVGKTSLCQSIASALGRRFLRIPLGGLRDEAQIRGHRRTYVGAMPGMIIQGLLRTGVTNPVLLLDEVDKIAGDGGNNPSAALLEALDPEQNSEFHDHYLGVTYDLSKILFLATANSVNTISPTLLDRLEVIPLPGYTEEEKVRIAQHSLLRRALESSSLSVRDLRITDAALKRIVRSYTQEPGVREFERQIGKIARKVAVQRARGQQVSASVGAKAVPDYLGPARRFRSELLSKSRIGVATGLVWTPSGGDLMFIEALAVPGCGKLQFTGQLGNVMKESAQTALSVARDFAEQAAYTPEFFFQRDLHIHLPAGSIPKEGASSGVTIATAVISLVTGRPVRRTVAMTGEISLHGELLPVTGIYEKVLAARAAGVEEIIVPSLNRRDVEEIQRDFLEDLRFHYLSEIREVLEVALLPAAKEARRRQARSLAAKSQ